ncbi:hypothetical protein BCR35DRAFT_353967 [Leucosporidium creatinivorum]|uniref:BTB domain-containing protein n=1 Tax=Leucosporidium creatinivorum TaxID=106004 RepID=A0A1Y2ERA7_9BASI|nr:hypothetical protein BCR35DRAFT_353967 [Leucosporidium creatinivorum]
MSRFVEIEEKRSLGLTWDIEMDINDTSVDLKLPAETRFGGDCRLSVKVAAPQTVRLVLKWQGLELGAIGKQFDTSAVFSWLGKDSKPTLIYKPTWSQQQSFPGTTCDDFSCTVTPTKFADAHEGNDKFNASTHRLYRIRYAWDGMMAPVAVVKSIPSHSLAHAVSPAFSSRYPNDMRLVFPHSNDAELWASSTVLATASPYFKTLLESDFAENVHRGGQTPQLAGTETNDSQVAELKKKEADASRPGSAADAFMKETGPAVDDSDDETDDLLVSTAAEQDKDTSSKEEPTYREVTITEASYSTYRALLLYLLTSHIKFAPLSSTFLPRNTTASKTRSSHLKSLHTINPDLPLPVSPKSIYRLAHVLEIPSLLAVSLDNIKSQLTISNAARELFSDTSALYDEVRAVILDFVVANWAEIKESEGMKEMERKTIAGEMPRAGAVLFKLMALVSK